MTFQHRRRSDQGRPKLAMVKDTFGIMEVLDWNHQRLGYVKEETSTKDVFRLNTTVTTFFTKKRIFTIWSNYVHSNMSLKYVFHETNVFRSEKTRFLAKKVIFYPQIPIISNDYENLLKQHLASLKYGINSGHQKYGSVPFSNILLS